MRNMVILLSTKEEEIVKGVNDALKMAPKEEFSTAGNLLQLLGLILLLLVILVAAFYTSKFLGKYRLGQLKDSNIQVIETYRISTNKMLQIVKIANKYVVIGISKDQITYIMELDEGEILTQEFKEGDKQSFRQIFEKIKGNKE